MSPLEAAPNYLKIDHMWGFLNKIIDHIPTKGGEFNAQTVANTAKASGKMDQRSLVLFEELAKAAVSRIEGGESNGQNLANTVNAFGKVSHHCSSVV